MTGLFATTFVAAPHLSFPPWVTFLLLVGSAIGFLLMFGEPKEGTAKRKIVVCASVFALVALYQFTGLHRVVEGVVLMPCSDWGCLYDQLIGWL